MLGTGEPEPATVVYVGPLGEVKLLTQDAYIDVAEFHGRTNFSLSCQWKIFSLTVSRAAGPNRGLAACVAAIFGGKPQAAMYGGVRHR